ncbi:MAG: hypothetical protein LBS84_02590 [Clostridiales bacterium]|jgi:hypothetical protein|nr:hypothetical protein [Clostridiales bacterium]
MNPEAKATIHDGRILVFNSAMAVEFAMLAHGVEAGRKKAKAFAIAGNVLDDFSAHLNRPVMIPSPGDRFAQALNIVKLIGKAAGAELYRVGSDCEWDPFFNAFQDGLTSAEETKREANGTLEDIFRECGKHADRMVSCVLPQGAEALMTKEGTIELINIIFETFESGALEELT